ALMAHSERMDLVLGQSARIPSTIRSDWSSKNLLRSGSFDSPTSLGALLALATTWLTDELSAVSSRTEALGPLFSGGFAAAAAAAISACFLGSSRGGRPVHLIGSRSNALVGACVM